MKKKYSSSLSWKRIIISELIIAMIPIVQRLLVLAGTGGTLGLMLSFNLFGSILIVYDWNLFALHYNRAKRRIITTLIYTVIGFVLIAAWCIINLRFLHGTIRIPDIQTVSSYPFAIPAVLIAYSYIQASIMNIGFKCLTDHLDIHQKEFLVILISGFLFGFFYTILFTPLFPLAGFIPTFVFNVILTAVFSYLYNQSGSIMPGILSMGTVYFIFMLILLQ